ncbi:DNA protecting protein DprA [Alteromonas sp. KUL42]|uniref:DNA-processing protein DprA n=1 Tax=Alteromonas sp. KUL42 TaxID=2480797 RepID=UPI000792DCBE|nr:DNA-processing protein DprA [Alteromonas sp. KUL42]KXJ60857.1 MAG: DNA processing protein DprA [Alteromonas sp. Nap_26]TAP31994.1 DNA-protecting protein DprA [Alteromonas sp. KUL42]GEA08970.1 DNA protecting protein DprA [Alteromonas sp. KUL42]
MPTFKSTLSSTYSANDIAWLSLASAQRVATKHWLNVLSTLTLSPEQLTNSSQHHTSEVSTLFQQVSTSLVEKAMQWLKSESGRCLITIESPHYPSALKQLQNPPLVLFGLGDPTLLNSHQIAIVGSRRASHQGKQIAQSLARDLSVNGITITSGLAMGIDSAAHKGGLEGVGKTIAVVGTGPDKVYPAKNSLLLNEIVSDGGLCVSEFFPGQGPKQWHFPRRNRIIAALTLGTLVVEAKIRSGTLITANLAADLGKEVFAVPGSIFHAYSEGCHWLIQQGAKLVTNANDIFDEIAIRPQQLLIEVGDEDEKSKVNSLATDKLLASVDYDITAIDVIAQRNAKTVSEVMASLLEYELRGLVAAVPGGYVKLRGK